MKLADRRLAQQALAALAAALPAPAAPAPQELIEPTPYYKSINSFDLAEIGYAGTLGRVVHGDPFGDLVGAMFFLVDGEVLWSPLPYALTSVAPLVAGGVAATDLAVLRDSQDERDVLVLTTASGLSVADYDPTDEAFAIIPLPGTGPWSSATQLKRSALPDGTSALSGLRSNGSTVRVSQVDETGETPLFSVTIPAAVLAHDVIDYHGDGDTDVAVVTTQGCFVFSSAGFILRREMVDLQAGGVVTFEAQGVQRLAFWYQDVGLGRSHLRVIDGLVTEPDLTLVAVPPGGVNAVDVRPSFAMAGDYDGDQNQDILLQIHSCFCVLLFNQTPPGGEPQPAAHFSVSAGAYDAIGLGEDPQLAVNPGAALAYFGNVDSDPGDDLIVPIDALERVEIFTRHGMLGNEGETLLLGSGSGDLVAGQTTYWWEPIQRVARLNLALDVPSEYLDGGAQEFEYLQVATWFQDGPTKQFPFPESEQNSLHGLIDDQHQWTMVEPLRDGDLLEEDFWPDKHNIWVLFRFVDADDTVNPIRVERASHFVLGAFTLTAVDGGQTIPPYLAAIEGSGDELDLERGEEPDPSYIFPPMGSNYVGAWVPQTSSTLFPPGDVPQFKPLINPNLPMQDY
jgi:hypothetical protein